MTKTHINIIKIVLSVLFVLCLAKMPYGYYQLIRFLGMTVFIFLAYIDNQRSNKIFVFIWLASALLINPFFKLALGRTIWNLVDIIWAIILLTTIFIEKETSE